MSSPPTDQSNPAPRAYSYQRWSTPEQGKGDSLRRQTEIAVRYAELHGLELDTQLTFRDAGVSAFKGRNSLDGALAAFRQSVIEGRIAPGSILIVESLDRISRQTPRKAAKALDDIIELGVSVLDAGDGGRIYSEESLDTDHTALLMMVLRFIRANEESERKSERLKAAYEAKRVRVAQGVEQPWGVLPAWLARAGDGKIVPIPERAAQVVDIFTKSDGGWGQHRIADWLNNCGVAAWNGGKYWHRSYIRKMLTNRAVVGTFTPHVIEHVREEGRERKRRRPLDPVPDRFPRIVDAELFERVSAKVESTQAKGRYAEQSPRSIFAGIVKCAHCGGTVTRTTKNPRDVYLVCSRANAKAKGCVYRVVRYDDVLHAMTASADPLIDGAPRGGTTAQVDDSIRQREEEVSALADECQALLREKLDGSVTAAVALRRAEDEWRRAQDRLRELRATQARLAEPYVLKRLERLRAALKAEPLDVTEANNALREASDGIVLDPLLGILSIKWRHSDEEIGRVRFWTRHHPYASPEPA